MPRKGKGGGKRRLPGARTTEMNDQRVAKIAEGMRIGTVYARITKLLGGPHLRAAIDTERGPKEVMVRIVTLFRKRGVTPLETDGIIALDVGMDFNPNGLKDGVMFDLAAVLTKKQALFIQEEGKIPTWMTRHGDIREHAVEDGGAGWTFGYEEEVAPFAKIVKTAKRKGAAGSVSSDEDDDLAEAMGGAGGPVERDLDVDEI
jgi:hypothetical protein